MTVTSVKIFTESRERPQRLRAVADVVARRPGLRDGAGADEDALAVLGGEGPRPRGDAPAWKMTGVRCGLGSLRWIPGTL